jgi:hypothetical protein
MRQIRPDEDNARFHRCREEPHRDRLARVEADASKRGRLFDGLLINNAAHFKN